MSSSDCVKVVCRFRPKNDLERKKDKNVSSIQIRNNSIIANTVNYNFDIVFDEKSTQTDIYNATHAELIQNLFNGFNCTLFAYGQTGTGKTYSLMGGVGEDAGLLPRLLKDIFNQISCLIEKESTNISICVSVSFSEIYLEKIRDLLNPSEDNLKLREGGKKGGVWIQGVTEQSVGSFEDVMTVLNIGNSNRTVGETRMNEKSSRSHSVFILTIEQTDLIKNTTKISKLFITDLAGSEKVSKTGATGTTLTEAQFTNKSLTTLGIVINKLTTKDSEHIPYRDSKLTRILSDALGGNSKTLLLITCSLSDYNLAETISTLRFGTRAKLVKNKPKANIEKTVEEYKKIVSEYEERIKIKETEETILLIKRKDDEITQLKEKYKEKEDELLFFNR
jgi:kinesin family member 5